MHTFVFSQRRLQLLIVNPDAVSRESRASVLRRDGRTQAQNRYQPGKQQHDENPVPDATVERSRPGLRQRDIGKGDVVETGACDDPTRRINDAADAVVGDPDQRQPFLDRAGAGDREMLERAGAAAVPGVVGDVEDPARARLRIDDGAGEDRLVADQWCEARKPWQCNRLRAGSGAQIDHAGSDLLERQDIAQRYVFAEWDEMRLVVAGANRAVTVDRLDAVPDLCRRRGGLIGPQGPGDDVAVLRRNCGD